MSSCQTDLHAITSAGFTIVTLLPRHKPSRTWTQLYTGWNAHSYKLDHSAVSEPGWSYEQ